MTLQNRVTPTGEIVAVAARGTMMGNRGGRLHDATQRLGAARWRSRQWIVCALAFRGRQRQVMAPGSYTELFFWDEAVALAAGHRPCAECRRAAFRDFQAAWKVARQAAFPDPRQSSEAQAGMAQPAPARSAVAQSGETRSGLWRASEIDTALHAARVTRSRLQITHTSQSLLPDGTFVRLEGVGPSLVWEGAARPWSWSGYGAPRFLPNGPVTVLTPAPTVAVLAAGYRPQVHPSLTS